MVALVGLEFRGMVPGACGDPTAHFHHCPHAAGIASEVQSVAYRNCVSISGRSPSATASEVYDRPNQENVLDALAVLGSAPRPRGRTQDHGVAFESIGWSPSRMRETTKAQRACNERLSFDNEDADPEFRKC